ncbi:hypothetical protein Salat_2465800 [Sesamum alatum]|uniref:Uncharacterized protein n=1 Tax=Sesamum alatum TaxID=300844 RepID=A0AAE2CBT3_9LAMI|nr:hypothetical protein Salat_2465800 [Sesamum alatum]
MASKLSLLSSTLLTFRSESPPDSSKLPSVFPFPVFPASQNFHSSTHTKSRRTTGVLASSVNAAEAEVEVADGYTITQFCDKMIDFFLNEKPKSKDWKRYLIFREEWGKYRERFYNRCNVRAGAENDSHMKQKLIDLSRKVQKIDDEMEKHAVLLKEIQDNPMDINAIVAKRRGDFTGDFFRHLTLLSETYDSLEDRDAVARLGARCLTAVSAFDNTLEIVGTLDTAQAKFDDILNSPSLDVACEKIKSLAKAKELDSSLILLINGAWASAKESTTMRNEVKEIMYCLYKATQNLKSDSQLASAFSPGDEHDVKQSNAIYTTPKELHKWIKIMLDAYHLNKEETEIREAKKMNQPVVIQRLFILKETIEEDTGTEYQHSTAANSEDT